MFVKSYDIVGYDYGASRRCPGCTIQALIRNGLASPAALDMDPEEVLDQIADANVIDRDDESSYDSDEFPKVVFADYVDNLEACDDCGGDFI